MKPRAILVPILMATFLSGCAGANTPVISDADACQAIKSSIVEMMATFEDQTASEDSVRLAFGDASGKLAAIAGSLEGDISGWATELSILSSKVAQVVANGDGKATVITVNELFASVAKQSDYCG